MRCIDFYKLVKGAAKGKKRKSRRKGPKAAWEELLRIEPLAASQPPS